ncbi:hypothetical protein F4810DRAFT_314331 [Camillea tinctor]|nr:hypothetical protein F4810DRAFT_314331 [Camillea tinctor]
MASSAKDLSALRSENADLHAKIAALSKTIHHLESTATTNPHSSASKQQEQQLATHPYGPHKMALWDDLTTLRYTGGDPVPHITQFNQLVARNADAGNTTNETQQRAMFLASTRDAAGAWSVRLRALLAAAELPLGAIQDDFVSEFHARKEKEREGDKRKPAPRYDAEVYCWGCSGKGHLRRHCRKRGPEQGEGEEQRKERLQKTGYRTGKGGSDGFFTF